MERDCKRCRGRRDSSTGPATMRIKLGITPFIPNSTIVGPPRVNLAEGVPPQVRQIVMEMRLEMRGRVCWVSPS